MRLVVPYKPREIFKPYHANTKRFTLTVAHRRAGKTVARINKLIKYAVECEKKDPRFGYLAPFYVQAKDIAWQYLKYYSSPLIELGGKVNESDLSVTFPHNNATIRLYGAENADRMRGLYFDGIVIDEAQGVNKSTLTQVIMPALADRTGWLDVSGTPNGWENLLGELARTAEHDKTWFFQILRASDTNILPKEELERQRSLMPDNEYMQEFECSFSAAITGAVYGQQISQAEVEGRVNLQNIHEKKVKVNTAWDLGYDDATAIWFWQLIGDEIRLLDYYENNNQDIKHYCDFLKERSAKFKYEYDKHYVPHDAAYKLLAAGGRSIVQQAYVEGIRMLVVPSTSQMNGIEAARKTLEKSFFDEKTEQGLRGLRSYQFLYDQDKKAFKSTPRHDWSSHASDSYEIIGQVWRKGVKQEEAKKPRFLQDLTAKEVFSLEKTSKLTEKRY